MAVSKEKFLSLFLGEFRENLTNAENQIIALKNDPGNSDALVLLLRTLHTIKGSSRMLQFATIEKLVHHVENIFKGVRDGRYSIDQKLVRFFFLILDRLRAAAVAIEAGAGDDIAGLDALVAECEKVCANEPYDPSLFEAAVEPAVELRSAAVGKPAESVLPGPARAETAPVQPDADSGDAGTTVSESSIRVDGRTIDRSISLVNTLTIRQLRLRAGAAHLEELESVLQHGYRTLDDPRKLRAALASVSRRLRQYRTQFSDQLFEMEHGTQELRESVISMRMLPLSAILERFPRMVEDTASALGKDVRLFIHGDSVRLDRAVLNKLSDPLIHLVRNAIDHGIEPPDERVARGKEPYGIITIACQTEGSRIAVTIRDDGRGLDYQAIRRRALELWPDTSDEIAAMPDSELARFLYEPGFSTRQASTTLSGRGIGLDIVKNNIEAARGQILLESESGQGCLFKLLLPVSASTMDGMFVLSGGRKYYIPASAIFRTLLLDEADVFTVRQKDMFTYEGGTVVLHDLGVCIQGESTIGKGGKIPVLLVHGAGQTAGLRVDRILGYDSLVFQNLPPGLRRHALVQGVVFDLSFDIVPILNMWAVLDRTRSVRVMDTHKRYSAGSAREKPTILVVDDSVSTREIEISMLTLEGYEVIGAVDGVDALEKLHSLHIALIVSDLNMPRMDGLQLLENIRGDEAFRNLPVILVTTVEDPAVRAKAEQLGANRYIPKSSFDQDNLIHAVRQLLAGKEAAT